MSVKPPITSLGDTGVPLKMGDCFLNTCWFPAKTEQHIQFQVPLPLKAGRATPKFPVEKHPKRHPPKRLSFEAPFYGFSIRRHCRISGWKGRPSESSNGRVVKGPPILAHDYLPSFGTKVPSPRMPQRFLSKMSNQLKKRPRRSRPPSPTINQASTSFLFARHSHTSPHHPLTPSRPSRPSRPRPSRPWRRESSSGAAAQALRAQVSGASGDHWPLRGMKRSTALSTAPGQMGGA